MGTVKSMVVYADILLAVNWWIDFLLLLGVRRAVGGDSHGWRLALGALMGAMSCFVLLLPPIPVWLSLLLKLVAAAVMVRIAFPFVGWRSFWRQLLTMFSLSAGLAGLCSALYFFVSPAGFIVFNGVVYYAIPPLLLVLLTVLCYGILWLAEQISRRRAPMAHSFTVTVYHDGGQVRFPCLYDSGNHLTEPFSGRPVMVVEREVLQPIMKVPTGMTEMEAAPPGWRLVPYESIGGKGLLPAFSPDRVTAARRGMTVVLPPCYVAVCDSLGQGEYRGILSSDMGENLHI